MCRLSRCTRLAEAAPAVGLPLGPQLQNALPPSSPESTAGRHGEHPISDKTTRAPPAAAHAPREQQRPPQLAVDLCETLQPSYQHWQVRSNRLRRSRRRLGQSSRTGIAGRSCRLRQRRREHAGRSGRLVDPQPNASCKCCRCRYAPSGRQLQRARYRGRGGRTERDRVERTECGGVAWQTSE